MIRRFQNFVLNENYTLKLFSAIPEGNIVDIAKKEPGTDNIVHFPKLYCQIWYNMYSHNSNDIVINNCIPVVQDHSDPLIESKWCQ